MPESVAAAGAEFFGSAAAEGAAATAGTAAAAGGTAAAAGGTAAGITAGQVAAAAAVAGTAVTGYAALTNKPTRPQVLGVAAPTPMADQNTIDQAKRASIIQQLSQRGRASTILTDQGSDKLG